MPHDESEIEAGVNTVLASIELAEEKRRGFAVGVDWYEEGVERGGDDDDTDESDDDENEDEYDDDESDDEDESDESDEEDDEDDEDDDEEDLDEEDDEDPNEDDDDGSVIDFPGHDHDAEDDRGTERGPLVAVVRVTRLAKPVKRSAG